MKKLLATATGVLLLLSACTGSSPSSQPSGSAGPTATPAPPLSIVEPVKADAKSLNPDWQNDSGGYWANGNIYSHLVILDWGVVKGTSVYGDLAESWDISSDSLTYTFHLRSGVKWHDGQPFTSADVVYTFQTIVDKEYPLAAYLKGATFTAPDDQTVVITLEKPNAGFLPLLAQASNWYGAILPKHVYDGTDWSTNPANQQPVGTGPFKFVSWDQGTQIRLEANPDYFLGAPELKSLTFQVAADAQVAQAGFDRGDYPYITNDYVTNFPQLATLQQAGGDPVVIVTPSLYDRSIMFNLNNPILAKPLVREAIAYALDRETMNQIAFSGLWEPTYNAGISSVPTFLDPKATFPQFDAEKAMALLDQAGYPAGADGVRLSLHLTNYPVADSNLIAEVVVQQLKDVGIAVTWDQLDLPTWLDHLQKHDFDMTTYFVRYGPDPAAYGEHFGTGAPRNFMSFSSSDVDGWVAEGVATTDEAARKVLYAKIQQELVKQIPYVPLFTERKFSLVHQGWEGFATQESGYDKAMGWFGYYAVHKAG